MIKTDNASRLNAEAIAQMKAVFEACAAYEGLTLTFPDLSDGDAVVYRTFEGRSTKTLLAFLVAYPFEEGYEVTAYTLPEYRMQGYFTKMFARFLEKAGDESAICFYPDGNSYDALMTLDIMEAQYTCNEHSCRLNLDTFIPVPDPAGISVDVCDDLDELTAVHAAAYEYTEEQSRTFLGSLLADDETIAWRIRLNDETVGMCLGIRDGEDMILVGLAVHPSVQNRHIASDALTLLLSMFKGVYRTVSVEVTYENTAAFALYRKAGFVTESELMEYWY